MKPLIMNIGFKAKYDEREQWLKLRHIIERKLGKSITWKVVLQELAHTYMRLENAENV